MRPPTPTIPSLECSRPTEPRASRQVDDLAGRLEQLEGENRLLGGRLWESQQRHSSLLGLYVAACRLLAARPRGEALVALEEVLASLVGCEHAALYALEGDQLRPVALFGLTPNEVTTVRLGQGVVGRTAASGQVHVAAADAPRPEGVGACLPLLRDRRPVGAVALFRLLSQKPVPGPADRELLELLSNHAASAPDAGATPCCGERP